ncbi:MAG TPA: hypothetical protein VLA56_03395 [Pseudomonadales bacterium]|nr:hypothetical protein [Pseudomonadales bacterium]
MRRRLRRQLLLAFVLGTGLLLAGGQYLRSGGAGNDFDGGLDIEGARRSITYLAIGPGQWLEFAIPKGTPSLRLFSNANIRLGAVDTADPLRIDYRIEFVLVGQDGVAEGPVTYAETGILDPHEIEQRRYTDQSLVPSGSQVLHVDLRDRSPTAIRVRWATDDVRVVDVGVRLSAEELIGERAASVRWQRLSRREQERLYAGSVYPAAFARSGERRELSRRRQRPLGPDGVRDEDYRIRVLYSIEDEDADDRPAPAPGGLSADARARAVIPIPPGGGPVHLDIHSREPLDGAGPDLALRWIPRGPGTVRQWKLTLDAGSTRFDEALDAGTLVLVTPVPIALSARVGTLDITPQPLVMSLWRSDGAEALLYRITDPGADRADLRIDLRPLWTLGMPVPARSVDLELLDEAGRVVERRTLVVDERIDPHERLLGDLALEVGRASRHHQTLPAAVRGVRIRSTDPVAIALYVRPAGLADVTRVPGDYFTWAVDPPAPARWFGLAPEASETLLRTQRRLLLARTPDPDLPDAAIAAGNYEFDSLEPQQPRVSRDLLLPREGRAPVRDAARSAIYRPLPIGRETALEFQRDDFGDAPRPRIYWRRTVEDGTAERAARVILDGNEVFAGRLRGREGFLDLPTVAPGPARLRVETSAAVSMWINHAGRARDATNRLLRRAMRITGGDVLRLPVDKRDAQETVTLTLFQPLDRRLPAVVDVRLVPSPDRRLPTAGYTPAARRFIITPDSDAPALVMGSERDVDGGEPFFVTLDADLPAGPYLLEIRIREAGPGYLAAYRIRSGAAPSRSFTLGRDDRIEETATDE